jgi:uncharacterized membrane protein
MQQFEAFIEQTTMVITSLCQFLAIVAIMIGLSKAMVLYFKHIFSSRKSIRAIQETRLEIGHSFSLALAFLIGTSILKTTFAPTWDDIGQLAAIIALRTGLNYFLLKNIQSNGT